MLKFGRMTEPSSKVVVPVCVSSNNKRSSCSTSSPTFDVSIMDFDHSSKCSGISCCFIYCCYFHMLTCHFYIFFGLIRYAIMICFSLTPTSNQFGMPQLSPAGDFRVEAMIWPLCLLWSLWSKYSWYRKTWGIFFNERFFAMGPCIHWRDRERLRDRKQEITPRRITML